MAINLSKGQKINLTKTNPGLSKVIVGLGWDVNKYDGGQEFDLDASAFLLDASGKASSGDDFIFYNNKQNMNASVVLSGDNLTGDGVGDDEVITVELASVPAEVSKVTFCITINEAQERSQNFGQVSKAYVRILNADNNEELIRYDLGEDYSIETAVVVGELYRNNTEWKFSAIGAGYQKGLEGLVNDFGL